MPFFDLFGRDKRCIGIIMYGGRNFCVVFVSKSGRGGMYASARLVCGKQGDLFHLVFFFTSVLGGVGGVFVCSIVVFVSF